MTPRPYTQRRRAEAASATRARIIHAAADLYRERGVAAATTAAVAERADVARGTVVNHFGSGQGLLEAVLEEAIAEIAVPDARALGAAGTTKARIHIFVREMFEFFERSSGWWQVFAADLQLPAVRAREAEYQESARRFQAAALGPLADDRVVNAALRAFVDYAPLHGLRSAGLDLDEAADVVADAIVGLIEMRGIEREDPGWT